MVPENARPRYPIEKTHGLKWQRQRAEEQAECGGRFTPISASAILGTVPWRAAARCANVRILRGVPFQRHHDTRVLPGRQIVRSDLLHGGLGVTDPVSGPVVLALN